METRKHYQSWVVRLTGARGSGKSLLLTMMGISDLTAGRKVWSNMPIVVTPDAVKYGTQHASADFRRKALKEWVGLQSIPLDWNAFYSLSDDLVEGTVLIDEAQYFSDSRSSLSLKNRLLNAIVAQVRKRSLNFYYTVKQGDWIDRRLSYETDIEVECQGMHHTAWGRANNVPQGDMVIVRVYDLSGAATGRPIDPKNKWHQSYKWGQFKNLHLLWGAYDTAAAIDLEEAFTNVKLDLKQRVITNKQPEDEVVGDLYEVAASLRDKGTHEISTVGFWGVAEAMGVEGSRQRLGRHLAELGITRKQKSGGSYFYDLTNLDQGA